MEEEPSNGGLLYHEVQESKLCGVHCVNTVLQGPFFTEVDLAAIASDLDRKERQITLEAGTISDDFIRFNSEESHNVSMDGDFSIQVLQKALEVWDLQVISLDCPVAAPAQLDPELENAFICHLQDHWFSIRKVNGVWYNFDSLYAAPEHLSRFYLSAYLDSLKEFGWSIFLVRGNFPKECLTLSTEAYNRFGLWLTPEDAQRITESCNSARPADPQGANSQPSSRPRRPSRVERSLSDIENENLEAAIAASLMVDSVPAIPETESICSAPVNAQTSQPTTTETGSIAESTRIPAPASGETSISSQRTTTEMGSIAETTIIPAPASGETSISSQRTTTETGSIAETTIIPAPASVETSISSQPTTTETGSIAETTRIPAPASAETSISSQLTTTETGFIAETTRIPAPVSARTSISSQPDRTETKTDVEDGKGSK